MEQKEFLNDLNPEQLQAATFKDGYELVFAGAGTGKTKMLISRVAWLISEGVSSYSILLLTFTKAAASEMKNRVTSMIGEEGEQVTACTFHSWCNLFLKRSVQFLNNGLKPDFAILQDGDVKDILRGLRKEMMSAMEKAGVKDYKDFPTVKELMTVQRIASNTLEPVDEIAKKYLNNFVSDAVLVLEKYRQEKLEKNRMDFDDMLVYTYQLLRGNQALRAQWEQMYKYVMCDEYQDTNVVQDRILDLLTQANGNLVVVGDDNQSIYRFRGAEIQNILNFQYRHPSASVVKLVRNYRSVQEILDLANTVMDHRTEGVEKILTSTKNGAKPMLCRVENEREEADLIVKYIQSLHAAGTPYSDIAVLCRATRSWAQLEAALHRNNMDYVTRGGSSFFDERVIRDLICILRVLCNPADDIAMGRVLSLIYGCGAKNAAQICEDVAENGFYCMSGKKYARKGFREDLSKLSKMLVFLNSLSLGEILDYLVNKGYYREIRDWAIRARQKCGKTSESEEDDIRIMDEQLGDAQALLSMSVGYRSIRSFLNDIVLDQSTPKKEASDQVLLSTIHGAKGLEYDTVVILGAVEGQFPRDDESDEDVAEDLRCMYVAITRAKNRLMVTYPMYKQMQKGKSGFRVPVELSSFLNYPDVLRCFQKRTF